MSDTPTPSTAPEPTAAELNLAAQRAQFDVLSAEWNTLDRQLAAAAKRLRACGELIVALERQAGMTDDYTNGQSHVKVGT